MFYNIGNSKKKNTAEIKGKATKFTFV